MTRILGIDPGSRITGFGIADFDGYRWRHVASGCIKTSEGPLALRLEEIFSTLSGHITAHGPRECAVEKVFVNRNVAAAMKLGQARGCAILAAAVHELEVAEYSATQIKQAIVGGGHAAKQQVQHMVRVLLALEAAPPADAADALAAAVCHGHTRHGRAGLQAAGAGQAERRR